MISDALTIYMRRNGGRIEGDRMNFDVPGGYLSVSMKGCETDKAFVDTLNNTVYNLDMTSGSFEHMKPIVLRSYDIVNTEENLHKAVESYHVSTKFGIIMNLNPERAKMYPEWVYEALGSTMELLRQRGYERTADKIDGLFKELGVHKRDGVLYADMPIGDRKLNGSHPFAENLVNIAIYEAPELARKYHEEAIEMAKNEPEKVQDKWCPWEKREPDR